MTQPAVTQESSITLIEGAEGTIHFNTITELYRNFLTNIYHDDINVFSCAFSVESFLRHNDPTKKKKKGPEQYRYRWEGHANIRWHNTIVHLHNPRHDPFLRHLEQKLRLLKEKIDLFTKTMLERAETPGGEQITERVWLNPESVEPNYTGYVYVHITPDGEGRFYIADCHRTINIWLEHWLDEEGKRVPIEDHSYFKGSMDFLVQLSDELEKSFVLIEKLRARFLDIQAGTESQSK